MLKMEKNFVAHIEKHYPRKPYEKITLDYLRLRLLEEVNELNNSLKAKEFENAKLECADVSNIIDYIFECLARGEGIR